MPSNTYSLFLGGKNGATSSSIREAALCSAPMQSPRSCTSSGSQTNLPSPNSASLCMTFSSMLSLRALRLCPATERNLHQSLKGVPRLERPCIYQQRAYISSMILISLATKDALSPFAIPLPLRKCALSWQLWWQQISRVYTEQARSNRPPLCWMTGGVVLTNDLASRHQLTCPPCDQDHPKMW